MDLARLASTSELESPILDTILPDLHPPKAHHNPATGVEMKRASPIAARAADAAERERAWRYLFRERTLRTVQRWLRRLHIPEADLADVTQVVMLEAYKSFPGYDPRLARPERWLNRIAVHVAAKLRDKARHRHEVLAESDEPLDTPDERPQADDALCAQADRQLFYKALDRVPHDLRLLLVRHHLDGVPMGVFAEMARVPLSTAYKWRARARSKLKAVAMQLLAMDGRD